MRIQRAGAAAVSAACLMTLLGGTASAQTPEEPTLKSSKVKLDPKADTSGQIVWERFGSADELPDDKVGETFSVSRLKAPRGLQRANTVEPQPGGPHPTPEREAELARKLGQTYTADGTETAAEQLGKFRSTSRANGIIDFAKCENDPLGEARDSNAPGHIIDHFNFCRWGYNQATKINSQGGIEGYIRFKEIEVGEGSKAGRTGTIHLKTKDVTGFGIYSEFSGASMKIKPSAWGDINHLGECGNNNGVDFGDGRDSFTRVVAGWEDQYIKFDITSDEAKADQSRSDKVSYCNWQTSYKVSSAKGSTGWSGVSPIGGMRFDSATYIPDTQYGSKGAVFNRVTPSFNYDRADTAVKGVAEHVFDALYAPQLTYPQKSDKDIPGNIWNGEWQPIHRNVGGGKFSTASDDVERRNRSAKDAACAGLHRPEGYECDEFPFASTKEGAGVGDGNFSVRMVPGSENGSAGSKLSHWYSGDRILDGDAYGIWVD
ncbi:NucA/NucB deoxyribonuclease domain-containing protein [Streptomyces sp. KR55]|uniref:NucA/NucB deoxyribonuclease domain-containing protein n=1 Tax=Streptomyces sp. KR55 TaxID=3457425 RepID=UPI003FD6BF4E